MNNTEQTAEYIYEKILSTRNMQYLGLDSDKYKLEQFIPAYNEIIKTFKIGKLLGKGAFKIVFNDLTDSKNVIKLLASYVHVNKKANEQPESESYGKPVMKANDNIDNFLGDFFKKVKEEKDVENLKHASSLSKTKSYRYTHIINDLILAYQNSDIINPPFNIYIYASSKVTEDIKNYIVTEKKVSEILDIITFIEMDIGILESIFVWKELKFIASINDFIKPKYKLYSKPVRVSSIRRPFAPIQTSNSNQNVHVPRLSKKRIFSVVNTNNNIIGTENIFGNANANAYANANGNANNTKTKRKLLKAFFKELSRKKLQVEDLHLENFGVFPGNVIKISNSAFSEGTLKTHDIKKIRNKIINHFTIKRKENLN